MICCQGSLICYALVTTVFQLIFPTFLGSFFVGLRRICLCANVLNFEYWHLFIACKNWLCGYETWMKAVFSWMKNTLFCLHVSPRNTGNRILGVWNSKIFWGGACFQTPPRRRGLTAPCWLQSVTLFKPAGYFNYHWNPWVSVIIDGAETIRRRLVTRGGARGAFAPPPPPHRPQRSAFWYSITTLRSAVG